MRWSGEVLVSQAQVGEALGMSRSNVHDAIERLIGYGLLQKTEKLGSLQTYRVSPFVAYRGRYVMLHMAQKQAAAQQRLEALAETLAAGQALDVTKVVQ
jgi:DNA-binding IclR family transcriptional regulator